MVLMHSIRNKPPKFHLWHDQLNGSIQQNTLLVFLKDIPIFKGQVKQNYSLHGITTKCPRSLKKGIVYGGQQCIP